MEDNKNKALKEISESLKQIAVNTKKEEKKPNYILNYIWIAVGIFAIYMLWKMYTMLM